MLVVVVLVSLSGTEYIIIASVFAYVQTANERTRERANKRVEWQISQRPNKFDAICETWADTHNFMRLLNASLTVGGCQYDSLVWLLKIADTVKIQHWITSKWVKISSLFSCSLPYAALSLAACILDSLTLSRLPCAGRYSQKTNTALLHFANNATNRFYCRSQLPFKLASWLTTTCRSERLLCIFSGTLLVSNLKSVKRVFWMII